MEIFLDSAKIDEIKQAFATGFIDGITTNPSLVAKKGMDFYRLLKEVSGFIKGPISAEVIATDSAGMMDEAMSLSQIADNIHIKLPLTTEGLATSKKLYDRGIRTNVTLCFSPSQAYLAARAHATYVSPFVGRLDDLNEDGMQLIADIKQIYQNYNLQTKILVASVRSLEHVHKALKIGADAMTIPYPIFEQMLQHDLTDKGLATFLADWQQSGLSNKKL